MQWEAAKVRDGFVGGRVRREMVREGVGGREAGDGTP